MFAHLSYMLMVAKKNLWQMNNIFKSCVQFANIH